MRRERPHPARSCRSPTTTATASRRSSPTSPTRISRPRAPSPPTRPRRGPDPRQQGHRPGQVPVQTVRPQRGAVGDRDARALPDRLELKRWWQQGRARKIEPKWLRYQLLHVAARLAFHGRRGRLRLQHDWPSAIELAATFQGSKRWQPSPVDTSPRPTRYPADPPAVAAIMLPETAQSSHPGGSAEPPQPHHRPRQHTAADTTDRHAPAAVTLAHLLHDPG